MRGVLPGASGPKAVQGTHLVEQGHGLVSRANLNLHVVGFPIRARRACHCTRWETDKCSAGLSLAGQGVKGSPQECNPHLSSGPRSSRRPCHPAHRPLPSSPTAHSCSPAQAFLHTLHMPPSEAAHAQHAPSLLLPECMDKSGRRTACQPCHPPRRAGWSSVGRRAWWPISADIHCCSGWGSRSPQQRTRRHSKKNVRLTLRSGCAEARRRAGK